jgi:hypothetical protein
VLPSDYLEDQKRFDAQVEAIAMRIALAHEEANGAIVKDVSKPNLARAAGLTDNPGFDLLSQHSSHLNESTEPGFHPPGFNSPFHRPAHLRRLGRRVRQAR